MERQGGGDSTLSRYFREMAGHRVLQPHEEVEAAKEVERLEIGYWEALLSYPLALETVAQVLDEHLEAPIADIATLRKLAAWHLFFDLDASHPGRLPPVAPG
jgi:hypothetical protein